MSEGVRVSVQTVFGRLFDPSYRAHAGDVSCGLPGEGFSARRCRPRQLVVAVVRRVGDARRRSSDAWREPRARRRARRDHTPCHNVVETLTRMRTWPPAPSAGCHGGRGGRTMSRRAAGRSYAWCTRATHPAGLAKPRCDAGRCVVLRLGQCHDEMRDADVAVPASAPGTSARRIGTSRRCSSAYGAACSSRDAVTPQSQFMVLAAGHAGPRARPAGAARDDELGRRASPTRRTRSCRSGNSNACISRGWRCWTIRRSATSRRTASAPPTAADLPRVHRQL